MNELYVHACVKNDLTETSAKSSTVVHGDKSIKNINIRNNITVLVFLKFKLLEKKHKEAC